MFSVCVPVSSDVWSLCSYCTIYFCLFSFHRMKHVHSIHPFFLNIPQCSDSTHQWWSQMMIFRSASNFSYCLIHSKVLYAVRMFLVHVTEAVDVQTEVNCRFVCCWGDSGVFHHVCCFVTTKSSMNRKQAASPLPVCHLTFHPLRSFHFLCSVLFIVCLSLSPSDDSDESIVLSQEEISGS